MPFRREQIAQLKYVLIKRLGAEIKFDAGWRFRPVQLINTEIIAGNGVDDYGGRLFFQLEQLAFFTAVDQQLYRGFFKLPLFHLLIKQQSFQLRAGFGISIQLYHCRSRICGQQRVDRLQADIEIQCVILCKASHWQIA